MKINSVRLGIHEVVGGMIVPMIQQGMKEVGKEIWHRFVACNSKRCREFTGAYKGCVKEPDVCFFLVDDEEAEMPVLAVEVGWSQNMSDLIRVGAQWACGTDGKCAALLINVKPIGSIEKNIRLWADGTWRVQPPASCKEPQDPGTYPLGAIFHNGFAIMNPSRSSSLSS